MGRVYLGKGGKKEGGTLHYFEGFFYYEVNQIIYVKKEKTQNLNTCMDLSLFTLYSFKTVCFIMI